MINSNTNPFFLNAVDLQIPAIAVQSTANDLRIPAMNVQLAAMAVQSPATNVQLARSHP